MESQPLEWFPTEILTTVLLSVSSISDLINLSATCHRIHDLYNARKLVFVAQAANAEFGPVEDIVQLVTNNPSQPAHVMRHVPLSLALLTEVIRVGRIAKRWEDIYPFKKWKENFERRRLLSVKERQAFRQALYRLWLYTSCFHNALHSRYHRSNPLLMNARAMLLHNWTTAELAQIADVRQILKDVLSSSVCPSNGTISRKFYKRYPDSKYQLLFNVHLNYPIAPPAPTSYQRFAASNHTSTEKYYTKYKPTQYHEPGAEGWGDDISHYYVVEDMLKLDPEQILWLKDNAPSKIQVEMYVKELGEWFDNNGETFGQTLEFVLGERCVDVPAFYSAIHEEQLGVVLDDP